MPDNRDSQDVTIPPKNTGAQQHPSQSLAARKRGFGIGGGYERPYKQRESARSDNQTGPYGAIAEGGFFSSGNADQRFAIGQAGFKNELPLYKKQFGEQTSGWSGSRSKGQKFNDGESNG